VNHYVTHEACLRADTHRQGWRYTKTKNVVKRSRHAPCKREACHTPAKSRRLKPAARGQSRRIHRHRLLISGAGS